MSHKFVDVPAWTNNYVSCAVNNGFVKGISETEFGSDIPIKAEEYITMLLRVLNYKYDNGHFVWDEPWKLSDKIGLSEGIGNSKYFNRGDMVSLSYRVLSTNRKNSPFSLYYYYFIDKQNPSGIIEDERFMSRKTNIFV